MIIARWCDFFITFIICFLLPLPLPECRSFKALFEDAVRAYVPSIKNDNKVRGKWACSVWLIELFALQRDEISSWIFVEDVSTSMTRVREKRFKQSTFVSKNFNIREFFPHHRWAQKSFHIQLKQTVKLFNVQQLIIKQIECLVDEKNQDCRLSYGRFGDHVTWLKWRNVKWKGLRVYSLEMILRTRVPKAC